MPPNVLARSPIGSGPAEMDAALGLREGDRLGDTRADEAVSDRDLASQSSLGWVSGLGVLLSSASALFSWVIEKGLRNRRGRREFEEGFAVTANGD